MEGLWQLWAIGRNEPLEAAFASSGNCGWSECGRRRAGLGSVARIRHPSPANPREPVAMKLVRFGPRGREKPTSSTPKAGFVICPGSSRISPGRRSRRRSLAKIRKQPIEKLPLVAGNPQLGACVGPLSAISSPSD